jgi:hypothetical protein
MTTMLSATLTLSVAVLAAQSSPAPQTSGASNDRLTVIGCVQRSPSPAATVGTTAIPEGGTRYVLSNITLAADTTAAPTAGAAVAEAVKMYRLDDSADSMLAAQVGNRVEVTGTLRANPPAPRGTTGSSPSDGPLKDAPLLKVESVKKISTASASCGQL